MTVLSWELCKQTPKQEQKSKKKEVKWNVFCDFKSWLLKDKLSLPLTLIDIKLNYLLFHVDIFLSFVELCHFLLFWSFSRNCFLMKKVFEPSIRYPVEFNTPTAESYWRILQTFLLFFYFIFYFCMKMKLLILSFCSHTWAAMENILLRRDGCWKRHTLFYFSLFFVNLAVIWQTLAGKSTRSTKARKGFIKRDEGFAGWWHSRGNSAGLQTKKSSSRCKNPTSTQLHGHQVHITANLYRGKFGDVTGLHVWSS